MTRCVCVCVCVRVCVKDLNLTRDIGLFPVVILELLKLVQILL